ncbi:MAG: hypothetical protein LAP21_21540 [Acidobacteriia bacterium]|nr:hypothetical protein [Terriglobia bacterium]
MLKAHLDSVEGKLLAESQIAANAGHSLHKGDPRESFIREFLEGHLSERVAIGRGEVIDASSTPNPPPTAQRPNFDIVLYKRDYPKLTIGGGISAFLAESVVATIEVKSTLDSAGIEQAIRSARYAKALTRNAVTSISAGFHPPSVLNYVVSYAGPAQMTTVHGWLAPAHAKLGVVCPTLPPTGEARIAIPSPSVDGIFVLGKGFVVFDNFPMGFITDTLRQQAPSACWNIADTSRGSLLLLFMFLTAAVSGFAGSWLNPLPYVSNFNVPSAFLP